MRKLVVVLTATGAILLASSAAWKADAQTAPGTIVELVLKPCLPGVPLNQCGVSVHVVHGSATFTPTNGPTITVQAGQQLGVNGDGIVSQSTQANSILNFASAGETTGSIGLGGGGGGNAGSPGAIGGTNSGSNPSGITAAASTGTTGLTTGGVGGGGSPFTPTSASSSVSAH